MPGDALGRNGKPELFLRAPPSRFVGARVRVGWSLFQLRKSGGGVGRMLPAAAALFQKVPTFVGFKLPEQILAALI